MATKDYKNRPSRSRAKKPAAKGGSWFSFLSGLGVGLVVAFGVYLWSSELPPPQQVVREIGAGLDPREAYDDIDFEAESNPELPKPKFDFYKILPEMEVPIPDWELPQRSDNSDAAEDQLEPGNYVLQVGSFKAFEDADRAKAKLALRGIGADIQRVVINGQDVWFRVHIGPLTSSDAIRAMRLKLIEHDMDFILLKIGNTQ